MNCVRFISVTLSLIFSLCSIGDCASPGEEWQKLVAAANKEGKVVIYGRGAAEYVNVYRDYFQKAFPRIKVNYVGGRSDLAHRLTAERRAGKYFPDLFLMSGRAAGSRSEGTGCVPISEVGVGASGRQRHQQMV